MTEDERRALELTRALWNALLALPVEHPDEWDEHRRDLHDIRCRIMARETVRRLKKEE